MDWDSAYKEIEYLMKSFNHSINYLYNLEITRNIANKISSDKFI
jgi:hypothetical protein